GYINGSAAALRGLLMSSRREAKPVLGCSLTSVFFCRTASHCKSRVSKMLGATKRTREPGGLVYLLSFPEQSLFWAEGIRHEIHACAGSKMDREYIGHCVGLLLRAGSWRLLSNAKGTAFRSFMEFCYAPRPHGLGLTRA